VKQKFSLQEFIARYLCFMGLIHRVKKILNAFRVRLTFQGLCHSYSHHQNTDSCTDRVASVAIARRKGSREQ